MKVNTDRDVNPFEITLDDYVNYRNWYLYGGQHTHEGIQDNEQLKTYMKNLNSLFDEYKDKLKIYYQPTTKKGSISEYDLENDDLETNYLETIDADLNKHIKPITLSDIKANQDKAKRFFEPQNILHLIQPQIITFVILGLKMLIQFLRQTRILILFGDQV